MPRLRDVIYINRNKEENLITYHGIEFNEFLPALPRPLKDILLIKHQFSGGEYSLPTRFDFVNNLDFHELLEDNVYSYGDFCWLDFEDINSLDLLNKQEVAELLYFGHLAVPVEKIFFDKLNNRFAYWAHDDGWYNKIYCRDLEEFTTTLHNVIIKRLLNSERMKIYNIQDSVLDILAGLLDEGLLIDFSEMDRNRGTLEIPMYTIGKLRDMDEMYHNIDKHKGKSKNKSWLIQKNKKWSIENY